MKGFPWTVAWGGVFNISRGRAGVSQSSALGSRSDCLKPGGWNGSFFTRRKPWVRFCNEPGSLVAFLSWSVWLLLTSNLETLDSRLVQLLCQLIAYLNLQGWRIVKDFPLSGEQEWERWVKFCVESHQTHLCNPFLQTTVCWQFVVWVFFSSWWLEISKNVGSKVKPFN